MKFIPILFLATVAFGAPIKKIKTHFEGLKAHINTEISPYYLFDLPEECLSLAKVFLPENPIIVEAGAFDGKESCKLAHTWPKGYVHTFEPVSSLYQSVLENTKNVSNISTYNFALGDQIERRSIYLSQELQPSWAGRVSMSSSLLAPKDHLVYSETVFNGVEEVDVTTLDTWAVQNNVNHVDMLWLDMQGYELPALKAGIKLLQTVSVILTELEFVEAYQGQAQYQEVKQWLEDQGFVLIAGNFKFPRNSKQWFGDGLFVRKELLQKVKW